MSLIDLLQKKSREGRTTRKEPPDLNMRSIISVGVVLVVGMCFAFILGILVGRGYRPENAVPQLANVMPTTEPAHDAEKPTAEPKVLKSEDLAFMDKLQNAGKNGQVEIESTQKGPSEPHRIGSGDLKVRNLTDTPPRKAEPTPTPARKTSTAVEPKKTFAKPTATRYRVMYQVAAFPAKKQAEAMAKKLAAKGLTASVREGKSKNRQIFRVDIRVRGTEDEITSALRRTGEKGPILLDKKPL